MATLRNLGPKFTINVDGIYVLGNSNDEADNGGYLVQIIDDSSLSASIVVKAQSWQARVLAQTDAFLATEYRGGNINGTAAAWAYVSTALTTNSLIFIPAGGQEVALDVDWTSGTGHVLCMPVLGSCAF